MGADEGVRIANFLCNGNYAVSGGLPGCEVRLCIYACAVAGSAAWLQKGQDKGIRFTKQTDRTVSLQVKCMKSVP